MAILRGKRPYTGKWYRDKETGTPFKVMQIDDDGDVRLISETSIRRWCSLDDFYERYKRIKEYNAKPISRCNNK